MRQPTRLQSRPNLLISWGGGRNYIPKNAKKIQSVESRVATCFRSETYDTNFFAFLYTTHVESRLSNSRSDICRGLHVTGTTSAITC